MGLLNLGRRPSGSEGDPEFAQRYAPTNMEHLAPGKSCSVFCSQKKKNPQTTHHEHVQKKHTNKATRTCTMCSWGRGRRGGGALGEGEGGGGGGARPPKSKRPSGSESKGTASSLKRRARAQRKPGPCNLPRGSTLLQNV